MKIFNLYLIILLALINFATTGCKDSEASALPLPVVDPETPTPGVIDPTGGFNIKVNPPAGTDYYIHQRADFDKKCTIAKTATAMADLDLECTVEVEELEGQFHGVDMVLNAPPDMCVYVAYRPYFYFGYTYGTGPTAATVLFNKDGNFVGGNVTGPGQINGNGTPMCDYDYSIVSGLPNCCMGAYTLTTTRNFGSVDPEYPPTTTVTAGLPWGGKPGNCAAGTGSTFGKKDLDTNMPLTNIYFSANGFNRSFTTGASIELNGGNSHYYANYYSGAAPTAFKMAATYKGNPYYEWTCLDDAYDVTARIRVQVREWNEIAQFDLKSLGDPDTSGPDPDWGGDVNQLWDWLDEVNNGNGYPGMH